MSTLGRALASLSNRWIAATAARRQEIISQTATTLRDQVNEAATNPEIPPTTFTTVVKIGTADADHFTNDVTETTLAESFDIDPNQHHIRSHVFSQASCGKPKHFFQVTILKRK